MRAPRGGLLKDKAGEMLAASLNDMATRKRKYENERGEAMMSGGI